MRLAPTWADPAEAIAALLRLRPRNFGDALDRLSSGD
jgi:hypothetical protein